LAPYCTPLTLPNVNRFSKLFHCQSREKICTSLPKVIWEQGLVAKRVRAVGGARQCAAWAAPAGWQWGQLPPPLPWPLPSQLPPTLSDRFLKCPCTSSFFVRQIYLTNSSVPTNLSKQNKHPNFIFYFYSHFLLCTLYRVRQQKQSPIENSVFQQW